MPALRHYSNSSASPWSLLSLFIDYSHFFTGTFLFAGERYKLDFKKRALRWTVETAKTLDIGLYNLTIAFSTTGITNSWQTSFRWIIDSIVKCTASFTREDGNFEVVKKFCLKKNRKMI